MNDLDKVLDAMRRAGIAVELREGIYRMWALPEELIDLLKELRDDVA